ncbi:hypothetical protein BMF35_a0295 [Aurantiacibacter gangjinensis]|nr:hypothetical protein BMF35_a0295 [Aurantiacibacter gangjinensis]
MDARIASLEAKLQEATCALPEFSANRCGAYAIEYERLRSERRALLWADMTYAPLTSLARRAQTGDEAAQLELGIRFEEGRGVVRDLDNARRLYRLAATPSGGDMPIYVPGVGDAPGTVQWFNTGPRREGLAEARERLQALDARMEGETQ